MISSNNDRVASDSLPVTTGRRDFLKKSLALSAGATLGGLGLSSSAQAALLSRRYPDASIEILDDSFAKYPLSMASSHSLYALYVNTRGAAYRLR